jgi:hypothetical protein
MGGTIIMADLGKVGITYDENGYVAETTYEPLTVLKYTDGGTYMSIAPTLGHLPTDTNYWVTVVPPITASEIGYTPIAGGVITNTNMQGAIEQSDSLKVSTNKIANNLTTSNAGYVLDARQGKVLNDSLTKLFQTQTIDALPTPTGEKTYFVSNGETTFPYAYGRLEIRHGSFNGEYVALYYTTGIDLKIYYNLYTSNGWKGWKVVGLTAI